MPKTKSEKKEGKATALSASHKGASRFDALRAAMAQVNKSKTIPESAKLHFADTLPPVTRISTGILGLDIIMGGGVPKGRFTQWKGEESCFKSSAILSTVAQLQAQGGTAAWIQGEEYDKTWAERWGVDNNKLILIPGTVDGEEAMERGCNLVESNNLDLLICDSVQGIPMSKEIEAEMGAIGYGMGGPQTWAQFCRRILRLWSMGADTGVIWTSQWRTKVGGHTKPGMPPPGDGTQIGALKHFKSVDVHFRKTEMFRTGGTTGPVYARTYAVKCDKNKTSIPHEATDFTFYGRDYNGVNWGIDTAKELATWGVMTGVIERSGAWYTVLGMRVNGVDRVADHIRELEDVEVRTLRERILSVALG